MKKTSKIFGTVALSAVLAMGCAIPAFAAPTQQSDDIYGWRVGDAQDVDASSASTTADTDINLRTTISQIDATLPLNLTVAAPVGGGAVQCPDATAYKISNNAKTGPIYVTGLKAVLEADWDGAASDAAVPTTTPASKKGGIYMDITAGTDKKILTSATGVYGTADTTTTPAPAAMDWTVPAATDAASGELGLALSGKASPITGVTTDQKAGVKVMKVTYTVSAMHPNNATQLSTEVSGS